MKTYDPIEILRERAAKSSQKQLAAELGVSQSYLSDVLQGRKEPGESILEPLELERVVTYRKRARALG